jgi:hypothetical protein
MRIGELDTGLRYMMTNEQRAFFEMLKELDGVHVDELDERSQRLAEEMTSLGLIDRQHDEETQKTKYGLRQRKNRY